MAATITTSQGLTPGLPGGVSAALNLTAAQVIKAAPGILVRITVQAAGTAGNLTLNDSASTGGAGAENEFFNVAYSALSADTSIKLEWPCAAGITVSSVPTGGQLAIAFT